MRINSNGVSFILKVEKSNKLLTSSSFSQDYQEAKRIYNETARVSGKFKQVDLERGFVITGLWSKSRHPNFVAEQAIWIFFYLWGFWTTQSFFNWSSIGLISYLLLFQGSTNFTEEITAAKYAGYKDYQKSVGKFLPNFSSKKIGHSVIKKGRKSRND